MKMLSWICIFLLGLISISLAEVDEVVDTIELAKSAYLQKEYRDAAVQLNRALAKINQLLIDDLKSFLPQPFNGWDADASEANLSGADLLASINVKRRYFKRGTGKSVEFEIISNAPQIPNFRMWLSNPQMLNADENIKIEEIGDSRCITRVESADRFAEVNLIIGSSILVRIRGFEAKNLDDLKNFARKLDLKKMETKFP